MFLLWISKLCLSLADHLLLSSTLKVTDTYACILLIVAWLVFYIIILKGWFIFEITQGNLFMCSFIFCVTINDSDSGCVQTDTWLSSLKCFAFTVNEKHTNKEKFYPSAVYLYSSFWGWMKWMIRHVLVLKLLYGNMDLENLNLLCYSILINIKNSFLWDYKSNMTLKGNGYIFHPSSVIVYALQLL